MTSRFGTSAFGDATYEETTTMASTLDSYVSKSTLLGTASAEGTLAVLRGSDHTGSRTVSLWVRVEATWQLVSCEAY